LRDVTVGLDPAPAVGIAGVLHEDGYIRQYIRCIGGRPTRSPICSRLPRVSAASLSTARGGGQRRGDHPGTRLRRCRSRRYRYRDRGRNVCPRSCPPPAPRKPGWRHAYRSPGSDAQSRARGRTAGNSCSYIELAVEPGQVLRSRRPPCGSSLTRRHRRNGVSRSGRVPGTADLRAYGRSARESVVTREMAEATAERFGARIYGGRGVIGALAAIALVGLPMMCCLTRSGMSAQGGRRRHDLLPILSLRVYLTRCREECEGVL